MGSPLLDLFPATVQIGDRAYSEARVVVLDGRALLFTGDTGQPLISEDAALVESPALRGLPYRLSVADSPEWVVMQGRGCGCRSPLKRSSQRMLLGMAGVAA